MSFNGARPSYIWHAAKNDNTVLWGERLLGAVRTATGRHFDMHTKYIEINSRDVSTATSRAGLQCSDGNLVCQARYG